MAASITKNDWMNTPDSDGVWLVLNQEAQEHRIVSIWSEPRHDSQLATNLGEEWADAPEFIYAKMADFPDGMVKRYKPRLARSPE